jgi:hypothetical protein
MTYDIGDEVRTTAMFNVRYGVSIAGIVCDVHGDIVDVYNGSYSRSLHKNSLARK